MCYAKKIVGFDKDDNGRKTCTEKDLGEDFDGQFGCARFGCKECNHDLVDCQKPKRNQGLRVKSNFYKALLLTKLKIL